MSRLSRLIAELCPHGVESKSLDELGALYNGLTGKSKADFVNGNARFVTYVNIFNNLSTDVSPNERVQVADGERQNRVRCGDVLFTASSESAEEVGMASGVTAEPPEPLYLNSFCFGFRPNDVSQFDPEFAKHLFRSAAVRRQIIRTANGVTRINISKERFRAIEIPLPPLSVQREIASILDKMERLKADLEAELGLRRTQQRAIANNFAVSLGRPGEPANWVALGSLARESSDPVKVQPEKSYLSLGVKWNGEGVLTRKSRNGDAIKARTLFRARAGQLIYNRMFVVEGSFAIVPEECDLAVVSGEFPLFDIDSSRVEPLWLLHHLCDPYTLKRIERETTGTERGTMKSRRRWQSDQFADFEILMPDLEVQREIVALLKASEALIRSLEDEISSRRKQYEYYRDGLLTFEEAA